jgi:hypothetical protein
VLCHLIKDICLGGVEGIDHLELRVFVLNVFHRLKCAGSNTERTDICLERVTHHENREVVFLFKSLFTVVNSTLESDSVVFIHDCEVRVSSNIESVNIVHSSSHSFFLKSVVDGNDLYS